MKKSLLILGFFLFFIFCTNDLSNQFQENQYLYGTWLFNTKYYGYFIYNGDTMFSVKQNSPINDTIKKYYWKSIATFDFKKDSFSYKDSACIWIDTSESPISKSTNNHFGKWYLNNGLLFTICNDSFFNVNNNRWSDTILYKLIKLSNDSIGLAKNAIDSQMIYFKKVSDN